MQPEVTYQDVVKSKRDAVTADQADKQKQQELAQTVVKAITDKGIQVTAQVDASKSFNDQVATLNQIKQAITDFEKSHSTDSQGLATLLSKVINAVQHITVNVPKIDTAPLADVLEQYFSDDDDGIDLDDYKPQDLKDDGDTQYIGFVCPSGNWYIVENDTVNNSLRYVFGNSNYAKAWPKAASYKYELLDKAVAHAKTTA